MPRTASTLRSCLVHRIRRLIAVVLASSLGAGCVTPQVSKKWNVEAKHTVTISVSRIGPAPTLGWHVSTPGGDSEAGWLPVDALLTHCSHVEVYPMRRRAIVGRLGPGPLPVFVPSRVRHDRIREDFWKRTGGIDCAVFVTVGVSGLGRNSVLHLSTRDGEFETVPLHPVVRHEWALLLPAAVVADGLIAVGFVGFWTGVSILLEKRTWTL